MNPEGTKLKAIVALAVTAVLLFTAFITTLPIVVIGASLGTRGDSASATVCLAGGAVSSDGWVNPVAGPMTSPYGPRPAPVAGAGGFHTGQDIAPAAGTPFVSASAGTVIAAYGNGDTNPVGDTGNGIIIDAGGGVELWYWHAQDNTTKVRRGDKVKAGQHLANVGSTGMSSGAHLHFEVQINGAHVEPVAFMKARGVTLGTGGGSGAVNAAVQQQVSQQEPASQADTALFTSANTAGQSITLRPSQLQNAERSIKAGRSAGMSEKAIVVFLMTALQESKFKMYANNAVPESLSLPHDDIGSDHDSVGLVQQRPSQGWGTVADLMNPEKSALKFWGKHDTAGNWPPGLLQIPGWEQMSLNDAAQAVQRSGVPDAYSQWEPVARALLARTGGSSNTSCTPSTAFGAGQALPGADASARGKIIEAAKEGLGGEYVWGGTGFKAWDAAGYVQWVMNKAGIQGVPRIKQWTVGKKTTTPQPGDLVVQVVDGPNYWTHVGIYAGDGMMYSALNPKSGTLLHPVNWNSKSEYFTLIADS